jgi:hypothetical protein
MSPGEALILFATMMALAALPSASVALVVTRSATAGLRHGAAVAHCCQDLPTASGEDSNNTCPACVGSPARQR